MGFYLGIDTSNYKTPVCIFDSKTQKYIQKSLPLFVNPGSLGLRQSDAVFLHIKNLPVLFESLSADFEDLKKISIVGVSAKPRDLENSYMPCFLAGVSAAAAAGAIIGVPVFKTSHQAGHVLAGVYSHEKEFLKSEKFLAFHLSGGTSEFLLVERDGAGFTIEKIGGTLDINIGQLIDRTGVMLGFEFPSGAELDSLCCEGISEKFNPKISIRDLYFNLSGHENIMKDMIKKNAAPQDAAGYVFSAAALSIKAVLDNAAFKYGHLPVLFTGGVSASTYLQNFFKARYDNIYFAKNELCGDNALGIAYGAYLYDRQLKGDVFWVT